jgi:hypothetical protein
VAGGWWLVAGGWWSIALIVRYQGTIACSRAYRISQTVAQRRVEVSHSEWPWVDEREGGRGGGECVYMHQYITYQYIQTINPHSPPSFFLPSHPNYSGTSRKSTTI